MPSSAEPNKRTLLTGFGNYSMQCQNKYLSVWITWKISAKTLAVELPLSLRSSTITDGPSKPNVFLFQNWLTEHQSNMWMEQMNPRITAL